MAEIKVKAGKIILSFGELLLRITPDAGGDWLHKNSLPFYIGGAELNVASALALWKVPVRYITALPDNGLTRHIAEHIKAKGIDLQVVHNSHRLGLYFLTSGKDLKHNALIYDRADSAFASLKPGDIDWDKMFDGIGWFHFSAICPAISAAVAAICLEAVRQASAKGITISIDLNYRSKLWQYGKTPAEIMPKIAAYCNLIMGNIWAAQTMLGIPVDDRITGFESKDLYLENARRSSVQIMAQYPACKAVANTFRFDAGDGINYYTTLYTGDGFYISEDYNANTILDKVGSGDCFMAGLIYGFYQNHEPQRIINFATAAAYAQLFVNSDATTNTVEQIEKHL